MLRSEKSENDIVSSAWKHAAVHKRTVLMLRINTKTMGDTLNILLIINKDFQEAAEYVFNPRNSMYISKNDGMFNNSYNHKRDSIINMNTLVQLSRSHYTPDQIERIRTLQA